MLERGMECSSTAAGQRESKGQRERAGEQRKNHTLALRRLNERYRRRGNKGIWKNKRTEE